MTRLAKQKIRRWWWDDWGAWVEGCLHWTAVSTVLDGASRGGPQSWLSEGTLVIWWQPVTILRALCLDHLKFVHSHRLWTLGWTRWDGIMYSECGTSRFQTWNPSSTQLRISWNWRRSWLAWHNRRREGWRWSRCPAWNPRFKF